MSFPFKACIIQVKDLFETSDALYIVLELYVNCINTAATLLMLFPCRVEGGELFDRVVSVGKFSERIAKLLFYQMLVAVKVRIYAYSLYLLAYVRLYN